MIYNMTNLTSATDFVGIIRFANEVTGDLFGMILLFFIFIVFFGNSIARGDTLKGFVVASFVTMISSWLMYVMGIVGITAPLTLFGLTLISGVFVGMKSKED
jgi:hypothetical protein